MVRLAALFIAVCMVIVAASVGIVLYLSAGISGIEAAIIAIALLTVFAIYNSSSTRLRDRSDVSGQIADLSRGTADLARQVGELGRRVVAAEHAQAAVLDKARTASEPLALEIRDLGALIKHLAETVAAHEAKLARLAEMGPAAPVATPPASDARPDAPEAPRLAPTAPAAPATQAAAMEKAEAAASGPFRGLSRTQIAETLRAAIDANRVDLYLQPIVSLPQRKVRYYEALARLRAASGEVLAPAEFLAHAETAGLMPKIDNQMLFRCVQVLRRLIAKNREVGLFCNVSAATLNDPEFFPQLSEFMQANRALAPSLVLEFSQAALRLFGPLETESLAALSDLGFRFSLDRLADLRIEPRHLADRGFRFVKVPADLLLSRPGSAGSDIHHADFSDMLGRFGIDLIAEKIETEGIVVDLLDYDVRFGQGFLFSPPRPVRLDGAAAAPDRSEGPAREPAAPEPTAVPGEPVPAAEPEAARPATAAPAAAEPAPGPERRTSVLAQLARGVVRRA